MMRLLRQFLWLAFGVVREPQAACNAQSLRGTRCIRDAKHATHHIDAQGERWWSL
jgi:hypothetical protein